MAANVVRSLIDRLDAPPGLAWAVVALGSADLLPEEEAAMARAVPKRRAEFAAGRKAARQAMTQLGLPRVAIPMGADRAPVWPCGVTGSISHAGGLALAVVAGTGAVRSVGVDLERDVPLDPWLVAEVCRPEERAGLSPEAQAAQATRLFSAKEAAYKAHYPLLRRVYGFYGLSVDLDRGLARFTDHPEVAAFPPERRADLPLWQATGGGHVLSLSAVSADRSASTSY